MKAYYRIFTPIPKNNRTIHEKIFAYYGYCKCIVSIYLFIPQVFCMTKIVCCLFLCYTF